MSAAASLAVVACAGRGDPRQGEYVAQMQRRRLLHAVVELAGEGVLRDASVGRVCDRAHVSRRTFYDAFTDFEDCLVAAFEHELTRLAGVLDDAYRHAERTGGWRAGVRAGLQALLVELERDPGTAQLCLVDSQSGPRLLACRQGAVDALAETIDRGRAQTAGRASTVADPPALTAETVVGGVLGVVQARVLEQRAAGRERTRPRRHGDADRVDAGSLVELTGPLTAMIVLPYLGAHAAAQELSRPVEPAANTATGAQDTNASRTGATGERDPFVALPIRLTARTALVLAAIAEQPDANNREVGDRAGIRDQGQISKLLRRLQRAGLLENTGEHATKGEPNVWRLTSRGRTLQAAIAPANNDTEHLKALDTRPRTAPNKGRNAR